MQKTPAPIDNSASKSATGNKGTAENNGGRSESIRQSADNSDTLSVNEERTVENENADTSSTSKKEDKSSKAEQEAKKLPVVPTPKAPSADKNSSNTNTSSSSDNKANAANTANKSSGKGSGDSIKDVIEEKSK